VDLRLSDEDGKLYVLEINAIAGMEEESGLSRSAAASGMDHRQMLEHLLRSAAVRSTTLAH
jgi:D-alanine-D-alanine ligase-like ATP-grasp enzyme